MRSQKREFVVEYKSRRKTQVTPRSIWADIDLEAASQAVQANTHLLFKKKEPANPPVEIVRSPEPVSKAEPVVAIEATPDKCDSPVAANVSVSIEVAVTPSVVDVTGRDRPSMRQKPKRTSKSRGGQWVPLTVTESLVSLEELVELEAENRRLKLALKTRLVHENRVLQVMLERFGR
ncbi:hypothetical protein HFO55_34785 [Rhizobium leguminosarum]|uniref:hypothetical protein n=1 Tax=Rhizobium leguminosarum TaxID=384 RepID=UPI001C97DC8D|nr:hypothetical protein [Rhizobium leguminosarum]MBY5572264.1 hypothetical protein [Rhizobium leguminosarum]MBY5578938.1 hypothetical protein [Rhizobium leguminosarum]